MFEHFGDIARTVSYTADAIAVIVSLATTYLFYRLRGKFITREEHDTTHDRISHRLEKHEERLNRGERRFDQLNHRLDQVATRDDLHSLERAVLAQQADTKKIEATLESIDKRLGGLATHYQTLIENELAKK